MFLVIMVTDRHTDKPTPVKTYSLAFAGIINQWSQPAESSAVISDECCADACTLVVTGTGEDSDVVATSYVVEVTAFSVVTASLTVIADVEDKKVVDCTRGSDVVAAVSIVEGLFASVVAYGILGRSNRIIVT